jgi:hypothetical protein
MRFGLPAWTWTKYIDNSPLTPTEIKRGQDLAKELGLFERKP